MEFLTPTLTTRDVEFSRTQYDALVASAKAAGVNLMDLLGECTLEICPIDSSYYAYRVSLAANATFCALFALSLIGYLAVSAFTWKRSFRSDHMFTFAMSAGTFLEILGYVGRLMSWDNQWSEDGFLMQIVCLTIAPAFMAGGIYLCLRRIVMAFGSENSRLKPKLYTRIFIPCDVLSLLLQAAGGGYASARYNAKLDATVGNNIMIAGLAFQVATLFTFMLFSLDFAIRTWRRNRSMGSSSLDQSPHMVELRSSLRFRAFLVALALATILIFWRSVFRVAELAEGWSGDLIKRQDLFIAFEGVMVVVAVLALNVAHPAFCFATKGTAADDHKQRPESDRSSETEMVDRQEKK